MSRRLRDESGHGGKDRTNEQAKPAAAGKETMMPLRRLSVTLVCFASLLGAASPAALAQANYPSRPIRFIVPLPPGGAIDVFVRAVGRELEARTGQTVLVENKAGANTIIAANACKSATPDGYTFCLLTRTTVSVNPESYRRLSSRPLK